LIEEAVIEENKETRRFTIECTKIMLKLKKTKKKHYLKGEVFHF